MKRNYTIIIASLIIGISIVVAATLYYRANRYEVDGFLLKDKYKGEFSILKDVTKVEPKSRYVKVVPGRYDFLFFKSVTMQVIVIIISSVLLVIGLCIFIYLMRKKRRRNTANVYSDQLSAKENELKKLNENSSLDTLNCSKCGTINPSNSKFCNHCGSHVFEVFKDYKIISFPTKAFERLANFKERFLAKLIDYFLLWIILFIYYIMFHDQIEKLEYSILIFGISGIVIQCIYNTFWLSSKHQSTPGRLLYNLQIIRTNNSPLTITYGFLRFVSEYITGASFGAGYFMMLFNKSNMTLHDFLVGTLVVKKIEEKIKANRLIHYRNLILLCMASIIYGFIYMVLMGYNETIGFILGASIIPFCVPLIIAAISSLLTRIFTGKWITKFYPFVWVVFIIMTGLVFCSFFIVEVI